MVSKKAKKKYVKNRKGYNKPEIKSTPKQEAIMEEKNEEAKPGKKTINILLTADSLKLGDESIDIKEFKKD